jgi:mannose-6-phosphate isomerase-like protein (cupin superfamily)
MKWSTMPSNPSSSTERADPRHLSRAAPGRKPVWTHQSTDLDLNLISCTPGQGIGGHVNTEVDVLLVGIEGKGVVEVDGRPYPVQPGQMVLIPKGSHRSVRCEGDPFAYLSCHRRRAGLIPGVSSSGHEGDAAGDR